MQIRNFDLCAWTCVDGTHKMMVLAQYEDKSFWGSPHVPYTGGIKALTPKVMGKFPQLFKSLNETESFLKALHVKSVNSDLKYTSVCVEK